MSGWFYFNKSWEKFAEQNLNQPGVLVELEDSSRYLLGHVNCLRGVCDDCTGFRRRSIVTRYKVLVDSEDL